MEEKILLLLLLTSIIFLSGCTNGNHTDGPDYKNDIITIESLTVPDTEPYAKSSASIDFDLTNNGDKTLDEVKVDFFDMQCSNLTGFKATLTCDDEEVTGEECTFENLYSFDSKHVALDIRAPDVSRNTSCSFRFSVSYNYSGARDITIPIIDGVTIKEPGGKGFDPGTPTYGPITIDVEGPNWGIIGKPFQFTMNFRYVDGVSFKPSEPVNISKDNIKLVNLNGTSIAKVDGDIVYCDFEENLLSKKDVIVSAESEESGNLICNFQSDSEKAQVDAHVGVSFSYKYKFDIIVPIKVRPIS